MLMHNAGRRCIYISIYLPPPGCSPPSFLSNSSIPLCPLLSLFSPLCHFSLEAPVLTSSSALTSAFSLPPYFQTLFGLFLSFFFFFSLSLWLSTYIFLLSRHLLSMGSSIAPIHRGVSSLCYSFLYALLFSLPLCRRSTPPPHFFFFLSSKSLSSVTHNSTISTVELVLWSLALFSLSSYIFYLSSVPSNFSCPGFLFSLFLFFFF